MIDYVPYQVAIIMFRIIEMICWGDSLVSIRYLMSKDCICKEICVYVMGPSIVTRPPRGGGVLQLVSERIRVNDSVTVGIRANLSK